VHELHEEPVGTDDTERSVAGVDQRAGSSHDALQHLRQLQLPGEPGEGLQQPIVPP
jgi:hypothetical protein